MPLFPRGLCLALTLTTQTLSTLVLDTGFFCLCLFPAYFRRQICFYLYFLVPGSSHSLFLKVFAGSAYLSQTDT